MQLLELRGELAGEREIGDDLLFGHVDDQARPFRRLGDVRLDDVVDRQFDQRVDRNVDGQPQIDAELGELSPGLERAVERHAPTA